MQPTLTIALRAADSAADKLNYTLENLGMLMAEGASKAEVIAKAIDDAAYRVEKVISNAYENEKVFFTHQQSPTSADKNYWQAAIICGQQNFAHGFPFFALVVAKIAEGKIEHVAVVNPMNEDKYTASRGRGAQFNERRIRTNKQVNPSSAFVASYKPSNVEFSGLRMTGCSVLDIVATAAGQFDAAFAKVEHPFELQAALVVAHEAGCLSGTEQGSTLNSHATEAMVANAKLFKKLISQ